MLILFQTIQPFPGTAPLSEASIACRASAWSFPRQRLGLRHLFGQSVVRCIEQALISGVRFAVDASLIEADTNRQNASPQAEWHPEALAPEDAPRAVREYLDTLDDAAFGAATSNAS